MRAVSIAVSRLAGWVSESAPMAIAVFILGVIAAPILVELTGIPERQALARETQLAEIVRSEAAFCDKYGMTEGSGRHRTCLDDLLDLRRQNEKRLAEQAEGLL